MGHRAWLNLCFALIPACGGDDHGSSATSSSSSSSTGGSADFCDALAVLETKCQRCHQNPPVNGAPFPLMTYTDTQAEHTSTGVQVYERMLSVIESGIMPPTSGSYEPPVEPLTCSEKATLLDWLNAGATRPSGNDPSCEDVEPALLVCAE